MNAKKTAAALWVGYGLFILVWMLRFRGHFPAQMDTLEYVYPDKWFNVESFKQGLIPLWDPYLACGTPHVANFQSDFFYPLFWLWDLTGVQDWLFTVSIAHGVLASIGFYLWLRVLKTGPVAATLCALSFGGSAYATLYWGFPTHLACLAWVPWIFWAALRLFQKATVGRWALLVVAWSFQILAGYPFFCLYTFIFLFIWLRLGLGVSLKMKSIQLGAFMAALVLTACQWLPFVDFVGYMHREVWGGNLFSLQWVNYLTLLSPNLLGVPGTSEYRGVIANYPFSNFYLGLVPLLILVWSFFSQKSESGFWRKSLVFWLFWPLGANFILWRLLPGSLLDKLEPSKATFLFVFCALTVLGLYLPELSKVLPRKKYFRVLVWVIGGLWLLDVGFVPSRMIHLVPDPYRDAEVQRMTSKVRDAAGEGRIVSLREKDSRYPYGQGDFASSFKESVAGLTPNTNMVSGIRSAQGYLTTVVDGYQNLNPNYLRNGYPYDGRTLDAANVSVLLLPKKIPAFKYRMHEPLGHLTMIRNPGAMGMGWEVGRAKVHASRPESFTALLDPNAFLENEVHLEKGTDGRPVHLEPSLRGKMGPSQARTSPCEWRWGVTSGRAGYFVFDQTFAPGWNAWVDGRSVPIFRANGLWMAVPLERSVSHQVLFCYEPRSFRLGLFLTLASLATLTLFGIRRSFIA